MPWGTRLSLSLPCCKPKKGDQITFEPCCHYSFWVQKFWMPKLVSHWSEWGQWGQCSNSCGQGHRIRSRKCPADSTADCLGDATQTKSCNLTDCPKPTWSDWSSWSTCDKTCGYGEASRTRECVNGRCTQGKPLDVKPCLVQECESQSTWSDWTAWSNCSSNNCGENKTRELQYRTRKCQGKSCAR